MSIWVTGSLEVRDSSDQLVFQVGDSSEGSPAKFSSLEVTGSFEVISDPINANPILTASYGGGDPDIPRVGIGVLDPPGVTLGVKGDLGLSDNNSDTRIAVVGTNAYVNVGQDTNNRGFMFWEGGQKRIRFGTKESGSTFFDSFIIKSGSADVQANLTVGNDLTITGDTSTSGLQVTADSIQSSNSGTPISWDTNNNVTIGRSIQINGGSIKASDGNVSISLGAGGDADIVNNLQVRGGEVKGAIDGHLYLKSDQNIYLDLDDDGDETGRELAVRNNSSSEIFKIAENGDVTTIGDISMANNKSITGVANVIVNYNTNGGTGNFIVERNGVDALLIDSAGKVTISEDLQLNENRILASDGGTPISWNTSDNVTIGGDLSVDGGNVFIDKTTTSAEADIRLRTHYTDNISTGDNVGAVSFWGSENGTDWQQLAYILAEADEDFTHGSNFGSRIKFGTATNAGTLTPKMELDNAGNLQIDGALQITGDEVRDSGDNVVLEMDGSGNISTSGDLAVIGGDILDSSFNTMISLGDDMSIGRPGAGSVSIGVSTDTEDAKMVVNSAGGINNRGVHIFRAPATTFNTGLRNLVEDSSVGFVYGARGEDGSTGKWKKSYAAMRVAGATNIATEIMEYPTSVVGTTMETDYWSTNGTLVDASSESNNSGNSMTLWDRVIKSNTAIASAVTNISMTKDIPCGPTYRIRVSVGTPSVNPAEATDVTKLQYSINGGSTWVDTGNEIEPTTGMRTDTDGVLFSWSVNTSTLSTTAEGIRFRLSYDPSSATVDIMYYGPISIRENTGSFSYPLVVSGRYPLNSGTREGRTESSNFFMKFCAAGSADTLGNISASSLAQETITYGAFTGAHEGYIEAGQTIDDFDILVYDSISPMGSEAIYNCRSSSSAMQKNVIGINGGRIGDGAMAGEISVVSLGNFLVKVCSQGGNLEIGDLICTSDVKGAGMKQSDDIIRSQTVARACENVDWSQEDETTKVIHCTVHCG